MITREQFTIQMERLHSTWSKRQFPDQRREMIWEQIRQHDYELMIKIVDRFISSSKSAPMPEDFRNEVLWQTRGRKAPSSEEPVRIDCVHCCDMGVLKINLDTAELLCCCDCEAGKKQVWKLPAWKYTFARYFERKPCPVEWFRPDPQVVHEGEIEQEKAMMSSINRKVSDWRARVGVSEDFWKYSIAEQDEIGRLVDV